jgi:ABC-type multidrug transport system permease subunit
MPQPDALFPRPPPGYDRPKNEIRSIRTAIADAFCILWADLRALKRKAARYLLATVMSPLLYLIAFGWGLGRGMSVTGSSYLEFVVPGIIALTAMNSSFNGSGVRLMLDQVHYRSFDESLMAPVRPLSLAIGKALIGLSRGLFSSLVFLAFAFLLSPVHLSLSFLIILILTCLLFSFMGVLAALLAKSYEDMSLFSSLTIMPMTFLAGTFFPVDQVPFLLKLVLYVMPLTHCSICLRASASGQALPPGSLLAIASFTMLFMAGSYIAIRKINR